MIRRRIVFNEVLYENYVLNYFYRRPSTFLILNISNVLDCTFINISTIDPTPDVYNYLETFLNSSVGAPLKKSLDQNDV